VAFKEPFIMIRNPARLTFPMLFTLAAASAAAADVSDIMRGCNDCHGENGVSEWTEIPTIAGLAEFVHADALLIYRDADRPCQDTTYRRGDTARPATNMCEIAATLHDAEIEAVAAAYAELPYVRAAQPFDAALATAGKAVHDEHCDRCHTDGGTNPEDEAGMLGGQQSGYLAASMKHYRDHERDQPDKMQEKIDLLSDDDVKALLNYYASLQ